MQESHSVHTNLKLRLISVKFHLEEDTKEDREACMKVVSRIISKDSWNGLIIDLSAVKDPMPVVEQLQIGQNVQKSLMSLVKTAIVYNPNAGNVNEFITVVSSNRGRNIKEFTDTEEAQKWALEH